MSDDKLIVYFDSDGVLANMQGFMDDYGIPYNPKGIRDKEVDKRMWGQLRQIPHFYAKFDELSGTDVYRNLKNEGLHCEVLTAIPRPQWGITGADEDKIQWCREHLGEDAKVNIVYRAEKKDLATDKYKVLVDDLDINIREWQAAGGTGIKFEEGKAFNYDLIRQLQQEIENKGRVSAFDKLIGIVKDNDNKEISEEGISI